MKTKPSDESGARAAPGAPDPHEWLSALADGEAGAAEPACRQWRADAQARQAWHAYHLIGDVLRSEDLAAEPAHDAAFLARLRERLAEQPVLLAPVAATRRRQAWRVPAAVAAGFVAVSGVLVVARMGPAGAPAGTTLASASGALSAGGPGVTLVATPLRSSAPTQWVSNDGVIRDPRLDEYLRAHQAARGGVALVAPAAALRRVDATLPQGSER